MEDQVEPPTVPKHKRRKPLKSGNEEHNEQGQGCL
jgi:hypothetical protein